MTVRDPSYLAFNSSRAGIPATSSGIVMVSEMLPLFESPTVNIGKLTAGA